MQRSERIKRREEARRKKLGKPPQEDEPTSPWEFIGNVCKYFRWGEDYVKWEMSFANLNMYLASIPDTGYDEEEDKKDELKQQKEVLSDFFSKATF